MRIKTIDGKEREVMYIGATHHLDDYAIVNSVTDIIVQTDFTELSAQRSVDILNEHEQRNDRNAIYFSVKIKKENN